MVQEEQGERSIDTADVRRERIGREIEYWVSTPGVAEVVCGRSGHNFERIELPCEHFEIVCSKCGYFLYEIRQGEMYRPTDPEAHPLAAAASRGKVGR
jgi:hypothetical protein